MTKTCPHAAAGCNYTKPQERQHLVEDLIKENGEATW